MQSVRETNPDLVLYDYTTNDIGASFTFSESKFRTVTESLVREILHMPKQPALIQLVLFRSLDVDKEIGGDLAQANILEPIASLYQFTLVSYRDAVWPEHDYPPKKESGVFDGEWVHPYWYVHQLIADILAYAWANSELEIGTSLLTSSHAKASSLEGSVHINDLVSIIDIPPLPPAQYLDDAIEALKSCRNPLTKYESDSWSNYAASSPPQHAEWFYVDSSMKEGWQFDANKAIAEKQIPSGNSDDMFELLNEERRLFFSVEKYSTFIGDHRNQVSPHQRRLRGAQHIKQTTPHRKQVFDKQWEEWRDENDDKDKSSTQEFMMSIQEFEKFFETHEKLTQATTRPCGYYHGISFNVQFGKSAGDKSNSLLISYLKSYEGFGRAVVFIDSNEAHVEHILHTQHNYFKVCLGHYLEKVRSGFRKAAVGEDVGNEKDHNANSMASPLIQARICNQMLSGEYDVPFTLNGHWADESSQTAVAVFNTQYSLHKDPFLFDTPVYVPFEDATSLESSNKHVSKPLALSPGWHNVSIALLKEGRVCKGGTGAHVNNAHLVGFSHFENMKNFTKFKILGIKSC